MKFFLSADLEGVAGITSVEETDPHSPHGYKRAQELMTAEVLAACEGALEAGATEIWVKDAHWNGRNLLTEKLPRQARVIRGWSGHPYSMVQELDSSFAALGFLGYHSRAGSGGNPLAHTLSSRKYARIELNGEAASEFRLHSYAGLLEGVPAVFLAGDQALCDEARAYDERIETVATQVGRGASNINLAPAAACDRIRAGVRAALSRDFKSLRKQLPASFEVAITYKSQADAYKASFYPGASLATDHTVKFSANQYFEVLRLLQFS